MRRDDLIVILLKLGIRHIPTGKTKKSGDGDEEEEEAEPVESREDFLARVTPELHAAGEILVLFGIPVLDFVFLSVFRPFYSGL